MTTPQTQYWAFRVNRSILLPLDGELEKGRLRQGWGYDIRQNLKAMTLDGGARRNMRMLHVKKGDRILIPHLPQYGQITIAEATEDWNQGYKFSIWEGYGDYGHIFPVKRLLNFNRNNENVPARLRGSFRNPCRFWNIDHLREDVEKVLGISPHDLASKTSVVDRWLELVEHVVSMSTIQKDLFRTAQEHFGKSDWEFLLTDVLQRLNPGWKVERKGGTLEAQHGTDILITIPDVFGAGYYGIAIQVKDYSGVVNDNPITQILKARNYWEKSGIKIVELVVALIGGDKQVNPRLEQSAVEKGVRLIWSSDVEDLVFRSACRFVSDPNPFDTGLVFWG
ncbi:MAG: hypothetical protein NTY01_21470 [Verrucomicrobia bacterium]|nr:hypothetical protein [Verrucomicrobiota bacterium]